MKRITKKAFREWLESHTPHAIVGVRGVCDNCPIARWHDANDAKSRLWLVRLSSIEVADVGPPGKRIKYKTPRWALRFIRRVDRDGSSAWGVRARTALRYLENS